jgi:hypothetical protein
MELDLQQMVLLEVHEGMEQIFLMENQQVE